MTVAITPDLFQADLVAILDVPWQISSNPNNLAAASQWPSIFSEFEIIVHWVTWSHKDPGGTPTLYDLLVSLGIGHTATMKLADV
ncbi:hypothetical protein EV702DRAFT_977427 [Suillus placidus]|uniref:Uncharacterized protein n=1 Tax=Suillus placidus TaxID=48579 RepID=A0A9P6ZM17_9AGAM|nr:hypothetical protein EV702DRAFT_977427 [Suillus placidus]